MLAFKTMYCTHISVFPFLFFFLFCLLNKCTKQKQAFFFFTELSRNLFKKQTNCPCERFLFFSIFFLRALCKNSSDFVTFFWAVHVLSSSVGVWNWPCAVSGRFRLACVWARTDASVKRSSEGTRVQTPNKQICYALQTGLKLLET